MLEINLLPWRDFLRAQRRRRNMVVLFGLFSVVLLVLCLAHNIFVHEKGLKEYMLIEQAKKLSAEVSVKQQLEQVKFVGYLIQDKRRCAILMLPSGEVRDVLVGAEIGMAGARVASVSEDKVILVLPDNRLVTLSY